MNPKNNNDLPCQDQPRNKETTKVDKEDNENTKTRTKTKNKGTSTMEERKRKRDDSPNKEQENKTVLETKEENKNKKEKSEDKRVPKRRLSVLELVRKHSEEQGTRNTTPENKQSKLGPGKQNPGKTTRNTPKRKQKVKILNKEQNPDTNQTKITSFMKNKEEKPPPKAPPDNIETMPAQPQLVPAQAENKTEPVPLTTTDEVRGVVAEDNKKTMPAQPKLVPTHEPEPVPPAPTIKVRGVVVEDLKTFLENKRLERLKSKNKNKKPETKRWGT